MLIFLTVLLAIAWIVGFTVLHVTSAAIHLLLLLAVVAFVAHFLHTRQLAGPR